MKLLPLTLLTLSMIALPTHASNLSIQFDYYDKDEKIAHFYSDTGELFSLKGSCAFENMKNEQSFHLKKLKDSWSKKDQWALLSQGVQICTVNTVENDINKSNPVTPAPAEVMPMPVEVMPPLPAPHIQYHYEMRNFSRSFVTDLADLPPAYNSNMPSAAILFKNSKNAKASNFALCEGFTQLPTPLELSTDQEIDLKDQVVTKMLTKIEFKDNFSDCDKILEHYNYEGTQYLLNEMKKTLDTDLTMMTGPFVVVFHPNSTQVKQMIDLSYHSPEEVKKFGHHWGSIFQGSYAEAQLAHKPVEQILPSKIKTILDFTICGKDSLIYIFNTKLGEIATTTCQAIETYNKTKHPKAS